MVKLKRVVESEDRKVTPEELIEIAQTDKNWETLVIPMYEQLKQLIEISGLIGLEKGVLNLSITSTGLVKGVYVHNSFNKELLNIISSGAVDFSASNTHNLLVQMQHADFNQPYFNLNHKYTFMKWDQNNLVMTDSLVRALVQKFPKGRGKIEIILPDKSLLSSKVDLNSAKTATEKDLWGVQVYLKNNQKSPVFHYAEDFFTWLNSNGFKGYKDKITKAYNNYGSDNPYRNELERIFGNKSVMTVAVIPKAKTHQISLLKIHPPRDKDSGKIIEISLSALRRSTYTLDATNKVI